MHSAPAAGAILLGDVLRVRLPQRIPPGHEQVAMRPAVVVGLPNRLGPPRFPLIIVAPMTTDRGQPWAATSPSLYPRLPAGAGGPRTNSLVLLDQVCALDPARVDGFMGALQHQVYQTIRDLLLRMLGSL